MRSLRQQIRKNKLSIKEKFVWNRLGELQLVATNHRWSESRPGEMTPFKVLTEAGLKYGQNTETKFSKSTKIDFYDDKFLELMKVVESEKAI